MSNNELLKKYKLPLSIVQPIDVNRVIRELSLIDEHLRQEEIRDPKKPLALKISPKLDELLIANSLNIYDTNSRTDLISWLDELKRSAPCVNISFGSEANQRFIEQLIQWFRREVNPYCLIVVGLEPSIGIGAIVRTDNKVFDLSLKSRLQVTRELLVGELKQSLKRISQ